MRRIVFVLIVFILLICGSFFYLLRPYYKLWNTLTNQSLIKYAFSKDKIISKNEINLVLLGRGDSTHEGANLTDSIQIANINIQKKEIKLISLPRDIYIKDMQDKINTIYIYALQKDPSTALQETKNKFSKILGMDIDYVALIDFNAFTDIIDALGGIEVYVLRPFVDEKYPIKGKENDLCNGDLSLACRYETRTFSLGNQTMDAPQALAFVRSRYAQGDEGTDFARQSRTQQVISSIVTKMRQVILANKPNILTQIYLSTDKNITRDFSNEIALDIIKQLEYGKDLKFTKADTATDYWKRDDPNKYKGIYVLTPPKQDFTKMQQYIKCLFIDTNCERFIPK